MIIKKPNKNRHPKSKLEINGQNRTQFVVCKDKKYVVRTREGCDNILIKDWHWIILNEKQWEKIRKIASKMAGGCVRNINKNDSKL